MGAALVFGMFGMMSSWERWAETMVTKAEIREALANGRQVSRQTLVDISQSAEGRLRLRAKVLLNNGYGQ